jgi:hypothetical protein
MVAARQSKDPDHIETIMSEDTTAGFKGAIRPDVEALLGLNVVSDRERTRFIATLSAVPSDAKSVLEIGFNDFRMTCALSRFRDVVTIDLPRDVTSRPAELKLVFATVRALPFGDRAFDIVVCTEVLEHLDDLTLRMGIAELQRVSSRYALVTVPYRQLVGYHRFKCSKCGHEEHCMGHLRRIAEDDLQAWFPGWRPLVLRTIGQVSGNAPAWVYACARRLGNVWFDYWTDQCPKCGTHESRVPDNILGFLLRRIVWRLQHRAPPQPAWLLAVFERT